MRCESCELDVVAEDVKTVPRASLMSAAANGFGPWGDEPPSMQWPRLVRHVWWQDRGGDGDATLCAACEGALQRFEGTPAAPHEWLADARKAVGSLGLRLAPVEPLGRSSEVEELARQLAGAYAAGRNGIDGGFATHGEKYGLAAATILLTADPVAGNVMMQMKAADTLAAWDDPRAAAFLVRLMRNPLHAFWVADSVAKRNDLSALPAVLDHLADFLRARHQYASGTPPHHDQFAMDANAFRAKYPDTPAQEVAFAIAGCIAIVPLLVAVERLAPGDVTRVAMSDIFAHSLFFEDLEHTADRVRRSCGPADPLLATLDEFRTADGAQQEKLARGWGRVRDAAKQAEAAERRRGEDAKSQAAKGSCFIATAAYGSEHHAEVVRLRAFRDRVLRRTRFGRALIRLYERVSPPVARLVARSTAMRALVRLFVLWPVKLAIRVNHAM